MPSTPVIDPVPWPPHSVPVDLKSAAIAFADTRGPDVTLTNGRYRRIIQQLEPGPVCALEVQQAVPLGFLDGVQSRVLLGRNDHRDLTLIWVGAGTVKGHTLLAHEPRLAVLCSRLDQEEARAKAPQVPVVLVPEATPWGVAAACAEYIDQARRHVESLAVNKAPTEAGKVIVVDGSLPRDSARTDLVGVCKSVETDWLHDPDLLPPDAGWRSPGPYPWILDTGCDYAAVGSVAVVRAVS
ncbi:MAG: hypothetical protein JWM84_268 [Nocardioides sp.]|nr:hypothetical protein [Nocardioides sp.]